MLRAIPAIAPGAGHKYNLSLCPLTACPLLQHGGIDPGEAFHANLCFDPRGIVQPDDVIVCAGADSLRDAGSARYRQGTDREDARGGSVQAVAACHYEPTQTCDRPGTR